jgi:hypothetical protein
MWRHYIIGRRFKLRKDCYGMKHLFVQPTLNARKNRWLDFLSKYHIKIKHIEGKENWVVDALNRRAHEVHVSSINMYKID